MKNYMLFLCFCTTFLAFSQTAMPDEIDTSYVAKFEVEGVGGRPANPERKIRLALKDEQPILSVTLCEGCYPATLVLIEELSDRFGELVFKNNFGVYILVYNEKGFVIAEPNSDENNRFSFIDFYTRSRVDYDNVYKPTIEAYAQKLLEIM